MDINKVNQVLEDSAQIQKDITSSSIMAPAGNTGLSRQFLDGTLKIVSDRNTPLRDRIRRKKGEGMAAAWNIRTTVNNIRPIDLVYAETGLGPTVVPTYVQKTASYKPLGYVEAISNFAIEAGRSYIDLEAEITEAGIRAVTQAEESLILHSDSTITNINGVTSFDGLDRQITTNVISSVGTFTTAALDDGFQRIRSNGGGSNPSNFVIVCSFGIQRVLNQIQQSSGNTRFVLDRGDLGNAPIGMNVTWYVSPIGTVPVIGDYFVNPAGNSPYPYVGNGSSSSTGNSTSTVYILDLNSMEMIDLLPLCKDTLPMYNADNWRVFVKEFTVLAVEVEQFNALLTGVTEPTY